MASLPEVMFSVSVREETSKVQAGDCIVRSCRTTITSRPATAFSTFGATAMSEPAHWPCGSASTGAVVVGDVRGLPCRRPEPGDVVVPGS